MQMLNLKCFAALLPYIERHQAATERPDKRLEDGDRVVGTATPEIKTLFGVHAELGMRHLTLQQELEQRAAALKSLMPNKEHIKSFVEMVEAASSPQVLEMAKACDAISAQAAAIEPLAQLAKDLFWAEVRASFSELAGKENIFIAAGWKIGYRTKQDDDDEMAGLAALLGGSLGGGGRRRKAGIFGG